MNADVPTTSSDQTDELRRIEPSVSYSDVPTMSPAALPDVTAQPDPTDELRRIYNTATKTSIMHTFNKQMIISLLHFRLHADTSVDELTSAFSREKLTLATLRERLQEIVSFIFFHLSFTLTQGSRSALKME